MPALPSITPADIPPGRDNADLATSRVGRALIVRGVLDTEGELLVLGKVLGRIRAKRFILAVDGHVEGDVLADDARIGGRLEGSIFAPNVAIASSADVTGRVFHHTVTVAKGARIDGRMPWRPLSYFESLEHIPETRP
jgi:cytoskeletal protein CcmA (bactofilin family)